MTNPPPTISELVELAVAGAEQVVTYGGPDDPAQLVVDDFRIEDYQLRVDRRVILKAPVSFIVLKLEVI